MKISRGEWIVVADGAKALVLENVGDAMFPDLRTKEVYDHDGRRTSELGTDKPGRAFNSVGAARSAVQQTDFHDLEEQRFLADLATRLHKAVQGGEATSLIVIAPPRALGVLRKEFSPDVRKAIKAEVEKDYVKLPVDQILRHLGD